jgi:phage shock protein PspC (stress-responsive transcriptional regulator)
MLKQQDDILSKAQIEQLIKEMGDVKEMDAEEEVQRNWIESIKYKLENFKLLRDTNNQQVAGVCAGLGIYFRIDPVIIRLIFSLFAIFGLFENPKITMAAITVYVLLWIAMPAAKTTIQRIEMKGENVTLGNIEKELKQPKAKGSGAIASIANMFESMFTVIGKVMKKCFELCVRGTGLLIVLGGIAGLVMTLIGFFSGIFVPGTYFGLENRINLMALPDFNILIVFALIAGVSGFSLLIELGVALVLLKNVLKTIPTILLLGITILAVSLLITLGMHDIYDLRTGATDNAINQVYLR